MNNKKIIKNILGLFVLVFSFVLGCVHNIPTKQNKLNLKNNSLEEKHLPMVNDGAEGDHSHIKVLHQAKVDLKQVQLVDKNLVVLKKLRNSTLNIKDLGGKSAKLINGLFEGDHLYIQVLYEATADLNKDGLIDGVLIIYENFGGSGNSRELCLMLNKGTKIVQVDQKFLGDRIKIRNLKIKGNVITIDYLDRDENDSLSDSPYIKKRIRYQVQGTKLKKLIRL